MWQIAVDEPPPFQLLSPRSLDEALELAARHDADCAFLAGGSDLLDQMKQQKRTPHFVINLKTIPGLRNVTVTGDSISIGALATLGELEQSVELKRVCPGLVRAASRVATPQIRNVGTLGGNLLQDSRCPYYRGPWHCYRAGGIQCDAHHGMNQEHAIFGGSRCYTVSPSDTAPALIALDARVRIRGRVQREISVEDLFVTPSENITIMHRVASGEVLSEIMVPVRTGTRSTFIKYAMRNAWDFAIASVGAALRLERGIVRDARIVLGGVAPSPWRSLAAEQEVESRALSATTIESAARAATAGAHPLAHNEYKVALVKKLVRSALMELAAQ
jgi:xanthine dehydrogenase YagS FAD-binding subunit